MGDIYSQVMVRLKPGSATPSNLQIYDINLSLLIQPQNGDVR